MSYMNRQQRRALQRRLVAAAWVLCIEYANGETEFTAFGNEVDGRAAFGVALGVKADEPDAIVRVALLDPANVEVASS